MAIVREDVSFKTLDGLLIKGWLFPAAKRGPGVIMTPGVCVIRHFSAMKVADQNDSSIASKKTSTQVSQRHFSVRVSQSYCMTLEIPARAKASRATRSILLDKAKIIQMPSHI